MDNVCCGSSPTRRSSRRCPTLSAVRGRFRRTRGGEYRHELTANSTALGNAILAHLPEDRVDEIIEQHGLPEMTENTITERDELFERLKRVRTEGVAFDDEARVKGLRCVAVPIVNNDDVVEGAISVSGPTSRLQGDRFRSKLPAKLKSVANVIELNITYT
nr:IclR family transcriptional regulator C-terminal domain-containing protein [Halomicrobium sp. IBSBa]